MCVCICVCVCACMVPWQQCGDGGQGTHQIEQRLRNGQGLHPQGVSGRAAGHTPHTEQQREHKVQDAAPHQHCDVHPHLETLSMCSQSRGGEGRYVEG